MCVVSHAITATLYLLSDDFGIVVPGASWLLLVSITSYACIYSAGLGPLTMIVRSELLPQAVKGIGSGLAVVSAAMSCFLLIFIFHLIQHHFGLAFNFLFFMVNSAGLAVLSHYTLPETKHKTLAEIQAAFSKSGWLVDNRMTCRWRIVFDSVTDTKAEKEVDAIYPHVTKDPIFFFWHSFLNYNITFGKIWLWLMDEVTLLRKNF